MATFFEYLFPSPKKGKKRIEKEIMERYGVEKALMAPVPSTNYYLKGTLRVTLSKN
jgi:hypothetical protein